MDTIKKLKYLNKTVGLSYSAIARWLGVRMFTVFRWINGQSTPRKRNIMALDDIFQCISETGIYIPKRVFPLAKPDQKHKIDINNKANV